MPKSPIHIRVSRPRKTLRQETNRGYLITVDCEVGFGIDEASQADARALLMSMLADKTIAGIVTFRMNGDEVDVPIRLKLK